MLLYWIEICCRPERVGCSTFCTSFLSAIKLLNDNSVWTVSRHNFNYKILSTKERCIYLGFLTHETIVQSQANNSRLYLSLSLSLRRIYIHINLSSVQRLHWPEVIFESRLNIGSFRQTVILWRWYLNRVSDDDPFHVLVVWWSCWRSKIVKVGSIICLLERIYQVEVAHVYVLPWIFSCIKQYREYWC